MTANDRCTEWDREVNRLYDWIEENGLEEFEDLFLDEMWMRMYGDQPQPDEEAE